MKERKRPRLDAAALWEYALRVLAGRAHSTGDLLQKLRGKAERAADVDPTIARLKEYGYLNDRKFAESFAAARLENEGLGKTRVLADLSRRRGAAAVAEQSVGKVYEDVNEQALAEDFVRRKFRMASKEDLFQDGKQMASAYRRLMRAGFRSATTIAVLKKFARDPDLLDGFEPPEETGEEGIDEENLAYCGSRRGRRGTGSAPAPPAGFRRIRPGLGRPAAGLLAEAARSGDGAEPETHRDGGGHWRGQRILHTAVRHACGKGLRRGHRRETAGTCHEKCAEERGSGAGCAGRSEAAGSFRGHHLLLRRAASHRWSRGLLSQAGEDAEAGRTHRGHRVLQEAAAIGAAREHEDFRRRADWRAAGGGLPQNEELRFSAVSVLRGV